VTQRQLLLLAFSLIGINTLVGFAAAIIVLRHVLD
jgi:hypothetical protein